MGFLIFLFFIITLVVFVSIVKSYQRKARIKRLMEKYGNMEIVRRIVDQTIWQGETREQLLESLGTPSDIEQSVMKTKTKETWKYTPVGKNRYKNKVIVENGVVVGWNVK